MAHAPQIRIPATYMRGGTSKGVFFRLQDLPERAQVPGAARDALLLRVIGSPDPYGKQIDGMGGATSSTSKTVILSKSTRPDHDVDYLFGQVSIDKAFVDWSGNCGNLSAAVGPFAISNGLVDASRMPQNGVATVRIWQANIGKTIIAHVPITNGEVQETGDFELDGVTFPGRRSAARIHRPGGRGRGRRRRLDVPDRQPGRRPRGARRRHAQGHDDQCRHPDHLRRTPRPSATPAPSCRTRSTATPKALAMFETIRAHGALRMGLIKHVDEAAKRQHTPKVAFVAGPADYVASSGKRGRGRRRRPAGARAVDGQAASRDDGHGGRGDRHRGSDSRHAGEPRRRRRRAQRGALRPSVGHACASARRPARSTASGP